jgi:hypothetical protein
MDQTKKQLPFWLEPKSLMGTSILWRPANILTSRDMERWAQFFSWQPKMDMTWWHDMNVFNVFRTDDDFCRNGPAFFWAPKGAWDVHVEIAAPGSQEDRSGAEGWQNQCRWFHRVKPGGGSAGSPSRSAGCTVKIDKLYIYIIYIYYIYPLVNWHRPWK